MKLGVLVSGDGTNLQAILDAARGGVLRGVASVAVVVSTREHAKALERARAAGVPAEVLPSQDYATRDAYDEALAARLRAHDVGLVCLAGFMRIAGPRLLAAFPERIINIHPSLLPSFPGLHAQRQALAHGAKLSGCTVHFVDAGIDTGPIIAQAAVSVRDEDDEESLRLRILSEEHALYPMAIRLFAEGRLERRGRRVIVRGAPPAVGYLRNPEVP